MADNTNNRFLPHSENLHILLWLIKDSCWLFEFKAGGMIMILPTVAVAVYIAIKTYRTSNFLPNLAVVCWILANAFWMICEFYALAWKENAFVFFVLGMLVISVYYVSLLRNSRKK